jgi:hypothetical protein
MGPVLTKTISTVRIVSEVWKGRQSILGAARESQLLVDDFQGRKRQRDVFGANSQEAAYRKDHVWCLTGRRDAMEPTVSLASLTTELPSIFDER